jgi:hypothetical protein
MKARPILFSAAMVQALLAGSKTQTRRIVKPQPPSECGIHYMLGNESWLPVEERKPLRHSWEAWGGALFEGRPDGHLCGHHSVNCLYGAPGDLLWVRETCRAWERPEDGRDGVRYLADDAFVVIENTAAAADLWLSLYNYDQKRRAPGSAIPSIHMPRWASRLTLAITAVRVERLQAISDADALAEGIVQTRPADADGMRHLGVTGLDIDEPTAARAYLAVWTVINGQESTDANPWTWAVSFEVHRQNVDAFIKATAA